MVNKFLFYLIVVPYCGFRSLFYRLFFSENKACLNKTRIIQPTQFMGKGKISIGFSQLGVFRSPGLLDCSGYIEARSDSARVFIADSVVLNNGFSIIADRAEIYVGDRCLIGPNFFVCDSDFHGISVADRVNGNYTCESVFIDSDVFIGEGVKVLKGVRIGRGAVIGSGSIVTRNVEENSIYAGVPAKKIGLL